MRRLLAVLVTAGLLLGVAAPALAGSRLPRGVTKLSVTLTFPLNRATGSSKPVHRTFTRPATVTQVVSATNALRLASPRAVCPMIVRLGPILTVVFMNGAGTAVAQARVEVVQGSRGQSGSSPCFPIRLIRAGKETNLIGNSWVRLIGRLIGTAIS